MCSPSPSAPDPAHGDPDPAVIELAHQMMDAAREGRVDLLAPLLERGAPVDMRDASGNTLLMLAAYHGHAQAVTELARLGADVDALNDRGQSPLAGAAFKGFTDVAAALLEAGADPEAGDPSGRASAQFFGRADIAALIDAQGRAR